MDKTITVKTAYTRIDLLVTIACVSILMSCLGAVGFTGREMAKRAVCASNINQNLEAMLAYAHESDGELPKHPSCGHWIDDLGNVYVVRFMQDYGMHKEAFYCPSNSDQQRFMDIYFHFNSVDPLDPSESQGFIVTGYDYILDTKTNCRPPIRSNGDKQWLGNIYVENPAQAELVIDTTGSISSTSPEHIYGHQFTSVTNHLKSEAEPWGGNMGFLDGHVGW